MDLMTGMIDMMIGFGCILATIVYRDTHGPFFFLGSDSEKASGMIWSKTSFNSICRSTCDTVL